FFYQSIRRHTRSKRDWSSDVCSSDLQILRAVLQNRLQHIGVKLGSGFAIGRGRRRWQRFTLYRAGRLNASHHFLATAISVENLTEESPKCPGACKHTTPAEILILTLLQ